MKKYMTVKISGKGILEATKKGTRKFANGKMIDPGEVVAVHEIHNIICNEGLYLIAGFTIDEAVYFDTGLTYCEIGTSNTAPAAGDTALTASHHRNAVTSRSRSNYESTIATFFTAAESTAAIEEAGIFGSANADHNTGNGVLFAHWLASFDNSGGLYDITISYILTIARG